MADSNASFIPKNTQRIQKRVRTTYRIYLLSYISYVFFFGTLIAVAGTFFYAIQVQTGLENVKSDLDRARQAFSETDIQGIRELEKRLLIADQMLSRLTSPSKVFTEVEKIVANNIQFLRFSYEALPNQRATISLTGKADDFNQIIYQRDLMNSSLLFENVEGIQFDYVGSILGEGDISRASFGTSEPNTDATLTFTVRNEISTTLIPYQPQTVATESNLVTEVRTVEASTEIGVVSDAAASTDGDEVNETIN